MTEDERYMKQAVTQAKKAARNGDVPIGCVIVYEGRVIARGYNKRNKKKTTLAHAELMAIEKASKIVGDWRLEGCTMYVTLEPCLMCAGAILQSRIGTLVFGAADPEFGAVTSKNHVFDEAKQTLVYQGEKKEECKALLRIEVGITKHLLNLRTFNNVFLLS